ncbi:excinuclease ABC subunit C [Tepidicaulis marinus]|uniref:Excinuclease ABC subunit C n=1 Tax=Tepidicaulis marinus TaxID=1333998 RepID=A0A081BCP8_9HYPH|nr:excinuclease ABC subunit C [Tepidicaulis marinus]
MKRWYLYILECEGERLYTGISTDVESRFAAHVKGTGAKFTRAFKPLAILYREEHSDRASASAAEARIKALSAAEKRALVAAAQGPARKSPAQRKRP